MIVSSVPRLIGALRSRNDRWTGVLPGHVYAHQEQAHPAGVPVPDENRHARPTRRCAPAPTARAHAHDAVVHREEGKCGWLACYLRPSGHSALAAGLDLGGQPQVVGEPLLEGVVEVLVDQRLPALTRNVKLNIPPQLFCMSWCPDFEFRGTHRLSTARSIRKLAPATPTKTACVPRPTCFAKARFQFATQTGLSRVSVDGR